MDLHFLGGAETVTGSQYLLTTSRARVLIDCGMFQGNPHESIRNRLPFAFEPRELDAVVLTHAHLDHCGLLPVLVREGYGGSIHATAATAELAMLVLLDSGRLHEEFAKREARWEARHPEKAEAEDLEVAQEFVDAVELARGNEHGDGDGPLGELDLSDVVFATGSAATGEHVATVIEPAGEVRRPPRDEEAVLRAHPPELLVDLDSPLYTEQAAAAVAPHFRSVTYGRPVEIAPGVTATFQDAGHILGSAIISLEVIDSPGAEPRTIVFSGDLGRPGAPILRDPAAVPAADYVVVESTYGGREHEPQHEATRILAETVRLVAEHSGVLLVPSFAIGRTQELVWQLDRLVEAGKIPLLPLYLDSPMATRATEIYRRHPEDYDDETSAILGRGDSPLDYPKQTITLNYRESARIEQAPRPYMIVASNGMLTGGRVVGHLQRLIDDPSATILFVGYQGEGTLGAHLQAGAETVKLAGEVRKVRCRIRSISGFSAHADEPAILDWLRGFGPDRPPGTPGRPRRVFLVHGDPEAQQALGPKVRALGLDVHVPIWHESVTLD
jgi:metallo-beta-lactamase family protein